MPSKHTPLVILALLLVFEAGSAYAAIATEGTQILNRVQLGIQNVRTLGIYEQELAEAARQINHYQRMLARLPKQNPETTRQAVRDIRRIIDIIREADALARYQETQTEAGQGTDPAKEIATWRARNHATINAALSAANVQGDLLTQETAALAEIDQQMQSSDGQTQVLEAIYRLAVMQVRQMQTLRQLMTVQVQNAANSAATATDRAAAVDEDAAEWHEAAKKSLKRKKVETTGDWSKWPK